jgi:DNA-binding CsgD family transcriptional regulator
MLAFYDPAAAHEYFTEAVAVADRSSNRRFICQIRTMESIAKTFAGDPAAAAEAARAGLAVSEEVGDRYFALHCRIWLGVATWHLGWLQEAERMFRALADEVDGVDEEPITTLFRLVGHAGVALHTDDIDTATGIVQRAIAVAQDTGGFFGDTVFAVAAHAELVKGDGEAARRACEMAWRHTSPLREVYGRCVNPMHVAALACGDIAAARIWADAAVASVPGYFQVAALLSRALIDVADDRPDHAVDDLCAALTVAASYSAYLRLPDVLECLARLVVDTGEAAVATRLLGAAGRIRDQMHQGRIGLVDTEFRAAMDATRKALSEAEFGELWAEGAALTVGEAIAYALRGRGRRRRPSNGWASLTPTEIDVVRLVVEGLGNRDIAARLFISHRTVQTHLTHVYTKLGCASRVQLAQEAAQRL